MTAVGASAPTAFSVVAADEATETPQRAENQAIEGKTGIKQGEGRGEQGKTPQRAKNQTIEGKTGKSKAGAGETRENATQGGKSGHRRENRHKVVREPGEQGKRRRGQKTGHRRRNGQKRGKSDEKPEKRSDLRGFAAKTGTQRENNAVRPKLPFAMPLIGHKITKMLF